jgi:hypothetical protein
VTNFVPCNDNHRTGHTGPEPTGRRRNGTVRRIRQTPATPVKTALRLILAGAAILLAGCQSDEAIVYEILPVHPSRTITLDRDQLLSLDWHSPHARGGRVTGKRAVAGTGVEFDLYFPSNDAGDNEVIYVSSGEGGLATLVGKDIAGYERFSLKFTLVSINGKTGAPELDKKLTVGAVIGPTSSGRPRTYQADTLSLNGNDKAATVTTAMQTGKIYQIGFYAGMQNPLQWTRSPARLTLRVEPVDHAGPVPIPLPVEPD